MKKYPTKYVYTIGICGKFTKTKKEMGIMRHSKYSKYIRSYKFKSPKEAENFLEKEYPKCEIYQLNY